MTVADKREEFASTSGGMGMRELLVTIWSTRNFVATVVLLVALALIGLIAVLRVSIPVTQTFQYAITFVFPQVEQKRYPNGISFSFGDLMSPAVLEKVYRDNALEKHGIKYKDFSAAVNVVPYSTTHNELVERYRKKLANRKLTFAERSLIEKQMGMDIERLSGSKALIRLTMESRFGLSNELGKKLVADIPRVWSQLSIKKRGVLKLPQAIEKQKLIKTSLYESLDYPSAIDLLIKSLNRLKERINILLREEGSETVIDKQSQHTVLSLKRNVGNFEDYHLRSFSGIIFGLAVVREPTISKLFLERRISMLQLKKMAVDKEATSILQGLAAYLKVNGEAINTTGLQASNSPLQHGTSIPQISSDFIDRIIDLSKRSNDENFRRELIEKHIKLKKTSIQLETEIKTVKELMDKTTQIRAKPSQGYTELVIMQKKQVPAKLSRLVDQLNNYWGVVSRLFDQLSTKRYSFSSRLFFSLSVKKEVINSHPMYAKSVIIVSLATLIAAAIAAMFAGLIWQSIGRR